MRIRNWIIIGGVVGVAGMLVAPTLSERRDQKIEIYRAFITSYSEGNLENAVNVANLTTRFDASNQSIVRCAPTVFLTTAISRHFRRVQFSAIDFLGTSARIVDPNVQAQELGENDAMLEIETERAPSDVVRAAIDSGYLQFSDVGFDLTGRRALVTYSFACGSVCGLRGTALFQRVSGRWVRSTEKCGPVAIS